MESSLQSIVEFVRVRQLNIALAGILTLAYLVYQYWSVLFKGQDMDEDESYPPSRLSRSRSRSRSRADGKMVDSKYGRRGRRSHRRCPDCSLCNLEQ